MANLLAEKHNTFWHDYKVLTVAGAVGRYGLDALPPVRSAIGSGFDTKTITLSCGKLTTGVTVPQWSSILMLRNLKSPETYFQAAFRVQSPWSIKNPNGDNPNEEEILKPVCFVFDFAPTRALSQLSDYAIGLSPERANPEKAVEELVSFLPVLAYDGSHMTQIDAGGILDIAMAGTSATLLARKWESALLVNVDNDTFRRILDNPEAMEAVERIEGLRALGDNVIETIINKSEKVKELKTKAKDDELTTEGEEGAHRRGEGVQVQAEARSGEADQVRDPHPCVHVPDRLPREHPPRRHHQAGARSVPCRYRPDGRGFPPSRAPQRVQHRADESGCVRVPALRGRNPRVHRYRLAPEPHSLRPLRHGGGPRPLRGELTFDDLLLECGDITDSPRNPRVTFWEAVLARYVGILPRVVHAALEQRLDAIVSSADSVSDDVAREASHRLQSLFQEYEFPVSPREPSGTWVFIGLGWWTIVNRQAKAITTLCDAGLAAESIPNARTALEHTFALVLLSRHDETTVPDGVLRNTLDDLARGVRSRPADEDPELVVIFSALAEELTSILEANWPERFATHAKRLGVYEETYSFYVGMCQLSHPTLGAVLASSDWLDDFQTNQGAERLCIRGVGW